MKAAYFLASLIFLALAAYFASGHYTHRPPKEDKALKATPTAPSASQALREAGDRGADIPALSMLWEKNIFDPDRGGAKTDVTGTANVSMEFELVGICKYGETSGAVIVSKNKAGQPAVPQPAVPGQPGGQPGAKTKGGKKSEKRFFKKGEQLANGFILDKINSDSVILSRGNEEIVLKLEFGDGNSMKRLASAAPAKPPPPVPEKQPATSKEETPAAKEGAEEKQTPLPKPPQAPPMMKSAQSSMLTAPKTAASA